MIEHRYKLRQIFILLILCSFFAAACTGVASSDERAKVTANPRLIAGENMATDKPDSPKTGTVGPAFFRSLELLGIKFTVESPNSSAGNTVTVTPVGLKISNDAFTSLANGEVFDAQVGDLNTDRSPEVYVFVRELGGSGRINVIGYATNTRKSMSEFILPEPDAGSKAYAGYDGHDEFEIVENVLSRRFPLFDKTGTEHKPTGKMRIVQYKIKPGEATWQFYIYRFDEF